ncbi:MAG: Flp pilus assembly protein CpaB [Planctomycetota bacterium]|nr:MAG: Flp pilus assembly protein CpaB [Planctomycetota bacterium]
MRPKSLVLLALALGCGLVASIGISQVLDGSNKPAAVETAPIYVALKNINVGDPLDEKMVSLEEWPKDKVPVGAITKWEDLADRRPRSNIYQGEPLLDSKLLAKGQTNDPIQGVPAGMRLKTISVDARKSAAGLLSPGDRVDVQIFVQRNDAQGISTPFTKIFLQNIRVYAVDQTIEKSADGTESRSVAKTVSLVVTPAQANRITLAENMGEVSLIPRHPDDNTIVDDAEQGADELFGRSTANSREREQLGAKDGDSDGGLFGLRSLVEKAVATAAAQASAPEAPAAPPKPAFQMTIVYPNEVSKVEFTANGEMIESKSGLPGASSATLPGGFTAATPGAAPPQPGAPDASGPAPGPSDSLKTPSDFPIDLKLN